MRDWVLSTLRSWRRWIRFVVVIVYIILLVIAVPLCIWELERTGAPDHVQAWFVGGLFVLMALPISVWGIVQHIVNYTTPHMQRYIIRILWMVPIYALNAWFALRFPAAAIYLDTLRECYEARLIEGRPPVKHIFPFCLLPPCRFSVKFIQRCKHGVLQYTVVRPAMTVVALICEMCGKYNEGDFDFSTAWSYIVIINNVSQILAMYCLVLFYKAFKTELQPLNPVPKFLCVKAVVFLSFWQAVLIAALAKLGAIPTNGSWIFYSNVKEVATGLQDFIICIEMFLAAIAHYFSFSHKPFINPAAQQQDCCTSFVSMWNVKDITDDVMEHAQFIGQGMKKTLSKGKDLVIKGSTERTPLLAAKDNRPADDSVVLPLGVLKSQTQEPLTPAVIVHDQARFSDDQRTVAQEFNIPFRKPTTASMINYIDFSSDSASQNENLQSNASAATLMGYDITGSDIGEKRSSLSDVKQSQLVVIAEINTDNRNVLHNPDITDENSENNFDNHYTVDEVFPESIDSSSYSNDVRLANDLLENNSPSPKDNSHASEHSNPDHLTYKESTGDDQRSNKALAGGATLVVEHPSFVEDSKKDVIETSRNNSEHNFPII
ncbi:unnamed protein product [Candidula unifasciata]|uniref:Transmembrane protein 184C n=1 Tax=Candidula unifasciata TaxID=100452 RepID=A0A8S4A609_9EUPU|nr:unnamed protein product [Candidula unifasciata]